ncbi:MAG: hypothetical protein A2498_15720 [Lentisphaerae bacterium RIFOXYC12_FULL_60_16]|nr:MAG: hypothetical protein A2498_15720 [Lentisphaerae bacterium RIFOXYC12_FULL_60_16]
MPYQMRQGLILAFNPELKASFSYPTDTTPIPVHFVDDRRTIAFATPFPDKSIRFYFQEDADRAFISGTNCQADKSRKIEFPATITGTGALNIHTRAPDFTIKA